MNIHERNQALAQLLNSSAPTHEPFHRKAGAAIRRLSFFNWFSLILTFLMLGLAIELVYLP